MRSLRSSIRQKLGVCQWFHFQDYLAVEQTVELLRELNVKHLRTGISWADFYREGGQQWYDWQMNKLREFELLVSVWHTPPSISEGSSCNSPPRRLQDYADFIDLVIDRYGQSFTHLELWNEPNNRYKWNFETFDPWWKKFGQMIGMAAYWAKQRGCKTVLGGMIPVDHHWLNLMQTYGVLKYIDVVAIHGFPGMWWPGQPNWDWHNTWEGWQAKVEYIRSHAGGRPIWVTETGLATFDLALRCPGKQELQCRMLQDASRAPASRVYWYSLIDLPPSRDAIEGYHVDENEYHMGLVTHDGARKPAFETMKHLLLFDRADRARTMTA